MQIHQLVYVSSAKKLITNEEINKILEVSRKNNKINNLTGVLLYRSGLFLQLLEGDEATVRTLYKKIETDSRHSNLINLIDKKSETGRLFIDWSMGYREISDIDVNMVNEVLSWNKLITAAKDVDSHLIMHMLERFKNIYKNN